MMYYLIGDATKVDLKTLKTEQVTTGPVVCRIVDGTVNSFVCETKKIEKGTMYLHKKAKNKLIELIPYLLKHGTGGTLSMKGLRFQRGFDLIKLLRLSGWYEHIDTSRGGYKQYGMSCLGSNHIIGLDIYGDLVVKTTGKGKDNKEVVIPFNYESLSIRSLEGDTFFSGLSSTRKSEIQRLIPREWREDF